MNPKYARLLTRLYPKAWKDRYGMEFETLLIDGRGGFGTFVNVALAAVYERIHPTQRTHATQGGIMDQHARSFSSVLRNPSAFLPLAMSLTALALVLVHIAFFGIAPEADEGPTAHLWQLLMAGQLPVLAFFAIRWLPKAPRPTLYVLGLQAGAVLASVAPVLLLGW